MLRTPIGFTVVFVFGFLATTVLANAATTGRELWSTTQAKDWGERTGWLVGSNFIPSTAINELEMWQADTFDLPTIDRELGWAEGLGFNSVRVFLHNIPWDQDPQAFLSRVDSFLGVAAKHRIGVAFVLFDSCWDPYPRPGKQREPQRGLHNSGWVQCPGTDILKDPARRDKLEGYVKGIIGRFKDDKRVNLWDVYNEPDNANDSSYGKNNLKQELPDKVELSLALLKKAFVWAREAGPSQPLTSAPWTGDWSSPEKQSETARFQFENSDVISFHMYANLPETRRHVEMLRRYDRPLVCTEYMARPQGSTFEAILPYLKSERIAAYNWGFVAGKTNTIYPWDSWQHPYPAEPKVWFHDIFRPDGTPFDEKEVELIRKTTGAEERRKVGIGE
jgi:hypothetical protein